MKERNLDLQPERQQSLHPTQRTEERPHELVRVTSTVAVGAQHRLNDLRDTILDLANYVLLMRSLSPSTDASAALFRILSPAIDRLVALEIRSQASYADLQDILSAIGRTLTQERGGRLTRDNAIGTASSTHPGAPTLTRNTFLATDVSLAAVSPESFEQLISEFQRFLNELMGEMTPEERAELEKLIIALGVAIARARKAGPGSRAATRALWKAYSALADRLILRGGYLAEWVLENGTGLLSRLQVILSGEIGGAGAAGFVLIDLVVLSVLLALWTVMWVKIGTWFWNRPISGTSKTYIDFWADQFYDLVHDDSCDELLDKWIQADRDLRQAESAGQDLGQLTNLAIHADVLAKLLQQSCPVSIKPVLQKRRQHYSGILAQFQQLVNPK